MPFKDPEKEREWWRKYWAERPKQRKAIMDRYRAKHREKILAYGKEYSKRTEVKERRAKYYLEHREEMLTVSKRNKMMKRYEQVTKLPICRRRKSSRDSARRKRAGITIERTKEGYCWKAGTLSNGPFNYRKEAIKDAEKACL